MANKTKQFIQLLFLTILLTITGTSVSAADDYHVWFQQQMQTQYGLPNGTWVFTDSEYANLSNMWAATDKMLVPVTNMPFKHALRVTVGQRTKLPWEIGMGMASQAPVAAGDKIVVSFWMKNNWAEKDGGYIKALFQDTYTYQPAVFYPVLPTQEWTQYFMSATAKQDFPVGVGALYLMIGTQLQEFEIGGVTAVNYGPSVSQTSLPQSPLGNYAGQEPDAAWRAEAAARIEQLRRGNLQITAVDPNGNPIPNAYVQVAMQSHAFDFGTAFRAEQILFNRPDDQIYREKLTNLDGRGHGFNLGVFEYEMQWQPWEGEVDLGITQEQLIWVADWLRERDIALRGHALIWPRWVSLPSDLEANQHNPAYLKQRLENRIVEMMTHPGLAGKFEEWDVLNEPRYNTVIADAFAGQPGYTNGEELYAELYNLAAATDPNAKMAMNEYNILNEGGMFIGVQKHLHQILSDLIVKNGGKIDRIGFQAHINYPFTPPERIYELLNEFTVYNKELRITEFEILISDEAKAGQYMRDFLTMFYSHPATTGFVLWNFWDGSHWAGNAPLFRSDWSLKPAGEAYIDLVFNQWWTDETGYTNGSGHYAVRGYTGDYIVRVIGPDGLAKVERVTLGTGDTTLTVVVDQQQVFLPVISK